MMLPKGVATINAHHNTGAQRPTVCDRGHTGNHNERDTPWT